MERIASVPGLPPILACAALLAIWEISARLLAIDGLPPASAALAQVPAILGDPELVERAREHRVCQVFGQSAENCNRIPPIQGCGLHYVLTRVRARA